MFNSSWLRQWLLMLLLLYAPLLLANDTVTVVLTEAINQDYTCNLEGKVIKVSDGDTITVMDTAKEKYKIRLAGIDAPEKKQDFGNAARKVLAGKIAGQEVCVSWHKKDKYGRLVGNVLFDGQSINLQMVQEGLAWHYKKYANEQTGKEQEVFAATERNARLAVIGLWSQPDPVPPWNWRHGTQQTGEPPSQAQPTSPGSQFTGAEGQGGEFTCGEKRFCKYMDSCAEAMFYLQQCGLSRLDKDGDGLPCESLCKR